MKSDVRKVFKFISTSSLFVPGRSPAGLHGAVFTSRGQPVLASSHHTHGAGGPARDEDEPRLVPGSRRDALGLWTRRYKAVSFGTGSSLKSELV